LYKAKTFI